MAIDGRLLAKARAKLADIKQLNADETLRRRAEIHARSKEIADIDYRLRTIMLELFSTAISGTGEIAKLERESLASQQKRAKLLEEMGYTGDYLDAVKTCKTCSDSGYVMGKMCDCLHKMYNNEVSASLSHLIKTSGESFENFDINLYDDFAPNGGVSPRRCMEMVFAMSKTYAQGFSKGSMNLLFRGASGLGKTYLSACIARVVSERGFSVVYETVGDAFEAFEEKKFSNSPESTAPQRVARMLACDLMILDDLGTEMPGPVGIAALYTLINSRIIEGKSTIISTNLSKIELERKYSQQIASRIEGEYQELIFYGRDIRKMKN